MEVNTLRSPDRSSAYSTSNASNEAQGQERLANSPAEAYLKKQEDMAAEKLEVSMGEMNKAMEALNSTIRFSLHEKTGRLMVQVVDIKKEQVIKEFPPHEFLDTMAKIRDYIGMILDIKG